MKRIMVYVVIVKNFKIIYVKTLIHVKFQKQNG